MTDTSFGYTIFYVEDVAASVAFFTEAFGFEQRMLTPENDYGELSTGDTTLAFVSLELATSNLEKAGGFRHPHATQPAPASITLVNTDVAAVMASALAAGAQPYGDLVEKPWGQTVGRARVRQTHVGSSRNGLVVAIAREQRFIAFVVLAEWRPGVAVAAKDLLLAHEGSCGPKLDEHPDNTHGLAVVEESGHGEQLGRFLVREAKSAVEQRCTDANRDRNAGGGQLGANGAGVDGWKEFVGLRERFTAHESFDLATEVLEGLFEFGAVGRGHIE
ncbi:hypothetical protein GQR58_029193 [Nymphon striatum]|nr:hypothetical protein GQR58_029193 [Nymphon striatum]